MYITDKFRVGLSVGESRPRGGVAQLRTHLFGKLGVNLHGPYVFAHRGDVPAPDLPAVPVTVNARPVGGEASALAAVQGELALAPQHAAPERETR